MDLSIWTELADSKTAAFLYTTFTMIALVIGGTITASLIAIYLIEGLESAARSVRKWIKKPTLWA